MKDSFIGAGLLAAVAIWYATITGTFAIPYTPDNTCQPDAGYTP